MGFKVQRFERSTHDPSAIDALVRGEQERRAFVVSVSVMCVSLASKMLLQPLVLLDTYFYLSYGLDLGHSCVCTDLIMMAMGLFSLGGIMKGRV